MCVYWVICNKKKSKWRTYLWTIQKNPPPPHIIVAIGSTYPIYIYLLLVSYRSWLRQALNSETHALGVTPNNIFVSLELSTYILEDHHVFYCYRLHHYIKLIPGLSSTLPIILKQTPHGQGTKNISRIFFKP